MKKKILYSVLILVLGILIFGAISASAAANGTCGENLTWTLDYDGTLTISGKGDMEDYYNYTKVPWNNYDDSIVALKIAEGVTSIGRCAFADCNGLISAEIPDSVTFIGESAFFRCNSLLSVNIGNGVTYMDNNAFYGCLKLQKVNITDIEAWCKIEFNEAFSNPLSNSCDLYLNNVLVTYLTIPDTITAIGNYAFKGCDSLTSADIPDSVTSIGECAFLGCHSLSRISIPDSVTSIGNYAFSSCSSLSSIDIPDGVTSIEDYAFYYCESLSSIDIPNGVTSIGSHAFYKCGNLSSIDIPDSVTSICDYAFAYCVSLSNIEISDSVTSMGDYTFYYCNNLISVNIGNQVASIGEYAFSDCHNLSSVDIGNGVTSIGNNAFSHCEKLISADIPDSVVCIGDSAFSSCRRLSSINLPDSVTSIGGSAFYYCDSLSSIEIPGSVTSIGSGAFAYCDSFTSIEIPDSVVYIDRSAFENCDSLISIEIPDSITTIDSRTFYSCDKLRYIGLPSTLSDIKDYAFEYSTSIEKVFYAGSSDQWASITKSNGNKNLTNATIVYNAVKKTYKFETNCDALLPDITAYAVYTFPFVNKEGSTLQGWYDNAALSGECVTFPYYGSATTLYAAWTDGTGTSFDDAIIAVANQQYTLATTTSRQIIYFEFVPSKSKMYNFYTTGNADSYGYLYNSNKSTIARNDDGGDGSNFLISYTLTAGNKYYIEAKFYSDPGIFGFVIEEPVDYKIDSITLTDTSGKDLSSIPTGTFLATISITNISSSNDAVVVLAQYSSNNVFKGMVYANTKGIIIGNTKELTLPVDNSSGDIVELKALCWDSLTSMDNLGTPVVFPAE